MPADRFDVVFRGELMEDQDPAQVRLKVRRLFKANDAQLQRLFSGRPVSIKQGVDMETASRFRLAFRQAGALVEIRTSRQPMDSRPTAPDANGSGISLAPANTGSLEDCAAKVVPAALPDISELSLAALGSDHEQAADILPPALDIDDLQLVPGQDWTLEDCQPLPLPEVQPDISGLDLAKPVDASHIPPEPPPAPLPDISDLSLAPVKGDDVNKIKSE